MVAEKHHAGVVTDSQCQLHVSFDDIRSLPLRRIAKQVKQ